MSDFYYTAGHSQCPGIFFGSIRVRDLQGTEIAFKLFLHCGFLGRLGKANFHDDLSVAEAVGVADLTDEVQYPFLFLPLQSIQKGACPMPENAGPR